MPMSCLARSPQVCGARDIGAPRARELGCRRARRSPARWSRVPSGASASSENETASSVDGEERRRRAVPGSFTVGETLKSGEGTTLVIRDVLGKGSFGTTYACERPEMGDEVALKVLTLREMRDWKALQLFAARRRRSRACRTPRSRRTWITSRLTPSEMSSSAWCRKSRPAPAYRASWTAAGARPRAKSSPSPSSCWRCWVTWRRCRRRCTAT